MSFHEMFLNESFYGANVWNFLGLFVTVGISLSCICRLNAMKPSKVLTSEQALYMLAAFWAMEAFTDLVFLQLFSGHDIAIGVGIILYLHSTYKDWAGDDCVSDFLNSWRKEHRERLRKLRCGPDREHA